MSPVENFEAADYTIEIPIGTETDDLVSPGDGFIGRIASWFRN